MQTDRVRQYVQQATDLPEKIELVTGPSGSPHGQTGLVLNSSYRGGPMPAEELKKLEHSKNRVLDHWAHPLATPKIRSTSEIRA